MKNTETVKKILKKLTVCGIATLMISTALMTTACGESAAEKANKRFTANLIQGLTAKTMTSAEYSQLLKEGNRQRLKARSGTPNGVTAKTMSSEEYSQLLKESVKVEINQ